MQRFKFLKLIFSFCFSCGFLCCNFLNYSNKMVKAARVDASEYVQPENGVTFGFSPLSRCYTESLMLNANSTILQKNKYGRPCMAFTNFYDDVLKINVSCLNRNSYSDKVFAVLIDKEKGVVVNKKFTQPDSALNMDYVSLKAPYFSDVVDVHFYKQNPHDEDFVVREENFLCKLKTFMTKDLVRTKKMTELGTVIALDGQGNVIENPIDEAKCGFFNRMSPNLYGIYAIYPQNKRYFGVIVLPTGSENKIPVFEDRVWPISSYFTFNKFHQVPNNRAFNFKLPGDVNEFEFHVYEDSLEEANFKWKYKIKLNKT